MLREIPSGYLKASLPHVGLLQESGILGLPLFCLEVFWFWFWFYFFPLRLNHVCTGVNAVSFPSTGNNILSV